MTDADGNFIISLEGVYGLNNFMLKGRVKCTFSITHRLINIPTDLSCLSFITEISNFFFLSNIIFDGSNTIRFLVQADFKHKMVNDYFSKYSLMSSKYLNSLNYLAGTSYLSIRLIKKLNIFKIKKNSMNKRTYYNWNHLKNFYE